MEDFAQRTSRYIRPGNHERRSAPMTAKILTAVPATTRMSRFADALTTLARHVRKLPTALAHRDQLRRLAKGDDRLLADVGFTQEAVDAALSAPFWRDPSVERVHRFGELKADRRCRTVDETAQTSGRSVVTSPELILAACNRRRLVAPLYLAGR
jgi:uncharacterized protein YjiS (DUF1127 family)